MTAAGDFSWARLLLASCTVLGLLAALAFVLKYIGMRGFVLPSSAPKPRRLRIVETLPVDGRRRLVILRCDGREHLLLLSAQGDIVVTTNLSPPAAADTPA